MLKEHVTDSRRGGRACDRAGDKKNNNPKTANQFFWGNLPVPAKNDDISISLVIGENLFPEHIKIRSK